MKKGFLIKICIFYIITSVYLAYLASTTYNDTHKNKNTHIHTMLQIHMQDTYTHDGTYTHTHKIKYKYIVWDIQTHNDTNAMTHIHTR